MLAPHMVDCRVYAVVDQRYDETGRLRQKASVQRWDTNLEHLPNYQ